MAGSFFNNWKKFLNEGNLEDYNQPGQIVLYHYSRENTDSLLLDPKYFLSHRSSFSRREHERSQVPRTFFYVDLDHAEKIVKSNRTLYTTAVPLGEIYNLKKDPEGILAASKHPQAHFIDYNKVLLTVKENYKGVFYDVGSFDVVAWFEPIEVNKEEL